MNQADLKNRAAQIEDALDALPARHPDRVELRDELRFIEKLIVKPRRARA